MTCKKKNQPPGVPSVPSGPASGRKGDTLRFSTVAEDPDGDSVAVRFDWGDSTTSDWSARVRSGDSVVMTHAWQELGLYSIRAQARDAGDTASAWSGEHQLAVASFLATLGGSGYEEGNSVRQTSDGGYIVVGSTESYGAGRSDVWLVKTDAFGNKVWDKTFGGPLEEEGYSVRQTSDGGYVITGYTASYGAGWRDIWLVKTDAYGNESWDRTFGDTLSNVGRSVEQTSDGGYIIAGATSSGHAGSDNVPLVKTDSMGIRMWDTTFGGVKYAAGYSVGQTADGGYVVTGVTWPHANGAGDIWLAKTDASGNEVWTRTFGGARYDYGYSVQQTSDGGYIVAGATDSYGAGYDDLWLVKTDASGSRVWDKVLGGMNPDVGNSVQQTSDGGYIVVGYTWSQGANYDAWLVKTDVSGNEVWSRTYGGSDPDYGNSVQQTSDGGYIIAGSIYSLRTGGPDVWLIKTDAEGN
jgi:hypothetical protein